MAMYLSKMAIWSLWVMSGLLSAMSRWRCRTWLPCTRLWRTLVTILASSFLCTPGARRRIHVLLVVVQPQMMNTSQRTLWCPRRSQRTQVPDQWRRRVVHRVQVHPKMSSHVFSAAWKLCTWFSTRLFTTMKRHLQLRYLLSVLNKLSGHSGACKTEFNAKWPFKVIQGHMFWSQWKGDKGRNNTKVNTNVGLIC